MLHRKLPKSYCFTKDVKRASSHGPASRDRGLFSAKSRSVPVRQSDVIYLNRAPRPDGLVNREVIIARPPPLLRLFRKSFVHGVPMHEVEPLMKLPRVPHKPVPELALPQRALGSPIPVQPSSRNLLHVVDHLRNGKRIPRPDLRMKMIRHQDVAAKQEPKPPARSTHCP